MSSATIRQAIRKSLADSFLNSHECYIGVGKSDVFNENDIVPTPVNSGQEEREFRNNLQSIKKVEGATFVAERVNWSSGTIYSAWTDGAPSPFKHYVMTDLNHVYVCLQVGRDSEGNAIQSTIKPDFGEAGVADTQAFTTADGYTWKFLFEPSTSRINQFLSSNYIPVEVVSVPTDGFQVQQKDVQDTAIGGQILGGIILDAGTNLNQSQPPSITVVGNGTGAVARAVVDQYGRINAIVMDDFGSGYDIAEFVIEGNVATVSPIITSSEGIGADPLDDLKTSSIMFNIKPNGTVDGTFTVENSFRQIGLVQGMSNRLTGEVFTGVSAKVMNSISLTAEGGFHAGNKVQGSQSGAVGYINEVDGLHIHYHQNLTTGFTPFVNGEIVNEVGGDGEGTIATVASTHTINRYSGEVLYIENRARIIRDAEQQEDIKVVITV